MSVHCFVELAVGRTEDDIIRFNLLVGVISFNGLACRICLRFYFSRHLEGRRIYLAAVACLLRGQ